MQHNHPNIAYSYHFLSEAIIVFLIAIPILFHRFFFVPYVSYLIVMIGACLLFLIISNFSNSVYSYLIVLPVLFITFQLLDYPIFFSILFSAVLTWRYIDIRWQKTIKRESLYILLTVLATIFASIFVHESKVMLYPFLVFCILFFGFLLSHFVLMRKEDIRKINKNTPLYFLGMLISGATIFYILFKPLSYLTTMIWRGGLSGFESLLLTMSKTLSFITVEKRGWPDQDSGDGKMFNEEPGQILEGPNFIDQITGLVIFGVALVLLIVIIIIVSMLLKRRITKHFERVESKESLSVNVMDTSLNSDPEMMRGKGLKRFFKAPEHPIRRLLFQFERKAIKNNKGRLPFETLEDWFTRIGLSPEHIEIYQRVRYGDQNVSTEDANFLKEQLHNMERSIIKG